MQELLNNLNPEQLEAVTHTDGCLLIVAGAGTGKTTVITRRIAYLIERGLAKPDEILALTFTDKAAGEMIDRVDQLLPLGSYDLWISTFHSFCERLLKTHGLDIGIPNDFELLDEVRQWILVFKNFQKFALDYYRPLGSPNKFLDALLNHFSKCKDEMITPQDYLAYAEQLRLDKDSPELLPDPEQATKIKRIEEVANAFQTYQKLLLDNEYLDFGDLINYALELFQRRPNILKLYQQQFKYILVDEFQDTNYAQYQLIKMLAAQKNGRANLVVVGDDDQSIYKFRGASVSNILKLKEDFPEVKQITLVQNYRSSQEILDLAYNFIQQNNPNRLETQLGINKKLHSNSPGSATIEVLEGTDLSAELDLVVKKILELKLADPASSWNEFAILIRANSAAAEILPRLDAAGIPYTYLANRGLYRKRLIYDLIGYLRLLDDHHDSSSVYRWLTTKKFAIEANDLARLTNYASKKAISLFEALTELANIERISPTTIEHAENFRQFIRRHGELSKTATAVQTFVTIINDLGIRDQLAADTLENAENREYLEQFFKRLETFAEQNEDKSIRNFIFNLNLEMAAGSEGPIKFDPNLGPESLKVTTIHAAKGLEFKFVFIINLVEQRFPTRQKRDSIEIPEPLIKDILPLGDFHLQEERRLFYVALTRAKTNLYLTWAQDYGGAKLKKPSMFLKETSLVPGEKVRTATGKVVFNRPVQQHKQEVYENLPSSFSFSELMMFEQCPMDYKFRSYLRLPMPGSGALSFGKTIHNTLQKFALIYRTKLAINQPALFGKQTETDRVPEFAIMEQLYRELWLDDWFHSKKEKDDYRSLGRQMLGFVYDDLVAHQPKIKYIEQPFKIPLGQYQFEGKIDRADLEQGQLVIIDYKTSSAPKIKSKKEDFDQLDIYQWAIENLFQEKVNKMYYWYLKDNQKVPRPIAQPEAQTVMKQKILSMIEDIRQTIKYDLFSERHAKSKPHRCHYEDYL